MSDFKRLLEERRLLKLLIENNLNRKDKHARHNEELKDYFVLRALTFSTPSAAAMSRDLGGPLERTIRDSRNPEVEILLCINEGNLSKHSVVISDLYEETYINDPDAPYTDISDIPIQISIDATAVNGKLSTRKLEELDDRFRMLYGACSRTHEQPLIKLEEDTEYKRKTTSRPSDKDEWFIVNGFSVAIRPSWKRKNCIGPGHI